MNNYEVFAQLEPTKIHNSRPIEFSANIVHVKTIQAKDKDQAFRLAKTIVQHPLVSGPETEHLQFLNTQKLEESLFSNPIKQKRIVRIPRVR
jgi:hypothetical protein